MNDRTTSTLNTTSAYRIKLEGVDEFSSSIFSDVYDSAKHNLLEIINQLVLSKEQQLSNKYDAYNNVIAFTGERGKGKSSSMISFLEALIDYTPQKKDAFYNDFHTHTPHFVALDVIDPSLFRGKETLFEIVLAKMFSHFKKAIEGTSINVTDEDRRKLVQYFQNVFGNLKYTTGNKDDLYNEETLEALLKLSTSSNLRDSFGQLVKMFLYVVGTEKSNNNILVITIDDFDLRLEGVYDMLEDVRQFLITPNVIILIACKMEQLRESIYSKIYSDLSKKITDNERFEESFIDSEIQGKAEKYIAKLVPITHRVHLPSLGKISDEDIDDTEINEEIELSKKEELTINQKNHSCNENKIRISVIPKLIFEHLGIYINPELYNYFYPKTLREYHTFIAVFDVGKNEQDGFEQKLNSFENYILDKIGNIGLHRRISEVLSQSDSKNYVEQFYQTLYYLESLAQNPWEPAASLADSPSHPIYPKILRLYLNLEKSIPYYENTLRTLLCYYRILFNIQHLRFTREVDPRKHYFFKLYDGEEKLLKESQQGMNRSRTPIQFNPADLALKKKLAPMLLYFGKDHNEYQYDSEVDLFKNFTISPVNGIFYQNFDLVKYFNIDLSLKYYEAFRKADYKKGLPSNYFQQVALFTQVALEQLKKTLILSSKNKQHYMDEIIRLIDESPFNKDFLSNESSELFSDLYNDQLSDDKPIRFDKFKPEILESTSRSNRLINQLTQFRNFYNHKGRYAKTVFKYYQRIVTEFPELNETFRFNFGDGYQIIKDKPRTSARIEDIIQQLTKGEEEEN